MKRNWIFGYGAVFVVILGVTAYLLYPLVDIYYDMFYPAIDRGQCSFAVTQFKAASLPSGQTQTSEIIQIDREQLAPITLSNAASLVELTSVAIKSDYSILDLAVQENNSLAIYHYNPSEYAIPIKNNNWENLVFSPHRNQFVLRETAGSDGAHLRLCSATTSSQIAYLNGGSHIAFNPQGTIIAVSLSEGIYLWDANSGESLGFMGKCNLHINGFSRASKMKFNADGTFGVFGCSNRVELWDVQKVTSISILERDANQIISVALSADEKILASADENNLIRLWGVPRAE